MPRFELPITIFRIHPPANAREAAPDFVIMSMLMRTLGTELRDVRSDQYYVVAVPSLQLTRFRKWVKKQGWYGREVLPDGTTKFM